ncbi:hypothetical protein IAG44_08205 [Streptomyces roseirectus]|uniref:Lipoprotein n=1 Tax=Streptomyces roseirectus TaxID=2768066 RepID=A0A7H0I9F6_9ACTN|nr:hypothetical protein [Streptomyces roseirectus]QNP69422.1 hypothetical protein IAG44_08205 [Streptomyces roseirectus]
MRTRVHAAVLTALSAACLTVVTATAVPAAANPAPPGFLAPGDLPPHASSAWTAGPVTAGVPEEIEVDTCLGMALGGGDATWHRTFRTELDTGAVQVSVVLPDERAAKGRYARIEKDIRTCAARIEDKYPDVQAEFKDYGAVKVEEGAHVFGLHTVGDWGATDVRLLGVGRDGTRVTVVDWGELGSFANAPVKAFKKTTVTAVNKLR